jgi:hypothetical protein
MIQIEKLIYIKDIRFKRNLGKGRGIYSGIHRYRKKYFFYYDRHYVVVKNLTLEMEHQV